MDPWAVAAIVAGYLIGSADFGVIVPRLLGVDIYDVGSGNPGTTNVLRSMGKVAAAVVLLGDMAKGLAAVALGDVIGSDALGFGAGLAAVTGHCFPVWHRFRGGKGVATTGGMALWMQPILGGALILGWALLVMAFRRASIASLVLAAVLVPGLALVGVRGWSLVWAGGASLLILYRHISNINRLISGSENTIEEPS